MSLINTHVIESFMAVREELACESQAAESEGLSTAAAILVLTSELHGARKELKRIAQVLGAGEMDYPKIGQSDTPDTMLSLMIALKATQEAE